MFSKIVNRTILDNDSSIVTIATTQMIQPGDLFLILGSSLWKISEQWFNVSATIWNEVMPAEVDRKTHAGPRDCFDDKGVW